MTRLIIIVVLILLAALLTAKPELWGGLPWSVSYKEPSLIELTTP